MRMGPEQESRERFEGWLKNERLRLLEQEKGNYSVKESSIEGTGLFAGRDFSRGEVISHYLSGGPYEDVRSSAVEEEQAGDEFWKYATQVGVGKDGYGEYISVSKDNPRSQLNNSCEPNAGLRRMERDDGMRDTLLIAIRPIKKGEELTIDYGTTQLEEWEELCKCGSPNCRGKMSDFLHLPQEAQDRYIELGIVPDFIAEAARKEREK